MWQMIAKKVSQSVASLIVERGGIDAAYRSQEFWRDLQPVIEKARLEIAETEPLIDDRDKPGLIEYTVGLDELNVVLRRMVDGRGTYDDGILFSKRLGDVLRAEQFFTQSVQDG